MTPIEILMDEHQLILKVLNSFESVVEKAINNEAFDHKIFGKYAAFFREFADRCHHGKEEDILFVEMMKNGFSRDSGPLAVMYQEHDTGRAQVKIMARAGEEEEISSDQRAELLQASNTFIQLLRDHIYKEDNILFQLALNNLPESLFNDMLPWFQEFDSNLENGGKERLIALGNELASLAVSSIK